MSKEIGRPRKEVDWKLLDAILGYGATLIDCSSQLEMSEDTIQKRIRETHDCTFSEYRNKKMARMRMSLLQKQYEVAMAGNVTMLIFLGKNHLGQSDKQEIVQQSDISINVDQDDSGL